MLVWMAIIRRGIGADVPAIAGLMASRNGSDIATPAPRKKVRRDSGPRARENVCNMFRFQNLSLWQEFTCTFLY